MIRLLRILQSAVLAAVIATLAQAQPVACNCPWREYTAAPTADVRRLFDAAERADTTAFLAALRVVAAPDSFVVDETPLIATIIWPKRWPDDGPDTRRRTYDNVPRAALDSLRAAHRASWPARERMLTAALARKVDPNAFTIHGMPPLVLAAAMASPAMVDRLLQGGANANIEAYQRDDVNAIEYALEHEFPFRMLAFPEFHTVGERTAIIRRLLRAGTKPPWAGARFRMPAHSPWALVAALTEGDSIAHDMLAAGLSATQVDVDGIPPLTAAAQFGNADVVRVLRDVGPRSVRVAGDSLMWSAAARRDTGDIDLWLDAVNAAAAVDTAGRIAELLLQRDMPWSRRGPLGVVDNVPRHHRGVYGAESTAGSDVVAAPPAIASGALLGRSSGSLPIVHAAAEANNVVLLRRLQAMGAPMDDTVEYRGTPLATAVRADAVQAVRWLIDQGSQPFRGGETTSPVAVALEAVRRTDDPARDARGRVMAQRILRAVSREHLTTSENLAWLTGAILRQMRPALPELDSLIARGWKPTGLSSTLLSTAIVEQDSALVTWLLDHGVPVVPEADSLGRPAALSASPLMLAVLNDDLALVQRLLRAGATIATAGRHDGLPPLGVALQTGSDSIAALLRGAGDSMDRIPTTLLVGLAFTTAQPEVRSALATRRGLPTHTVPSWPSLRKRLLRDSVALREMMPRFVRADARILRYSASFQEADSASGSVLELLLRAALDSVDRSQDVAGVDALLTARLGQLQRLGVLPVAACTNGVGVVAEQQRGAGGDAVGRLAAGNAAVALGIAGRRCRARRANCCWGLRPAGRMSRWRRRRVVGGRGYDWARRAQREL